jgi:hypothetical protein
MIRLLSPGKARMARHIVWLLPVLLGVGLSRPAYAQERKAPVVAEDLTSRVVRASCKLINPKSTATVFLVARPVAGKDGKSETILVTAAHVLNQAEGETVTLQLRVKKGEGQYQKVLAKLAIRQGAKPLWKQHAQADVAAIRLRLPKGTDLARLPLDVLADDAALQKVEVRPGDVVRSCGYPHRDEAGPSGFPLVRLGCVAGYPLWPAKEVKTFLVALNAFEGDSGGPLYLVESNRFYRGKVHEGRVQLVLGLVAGQRFVDEQVNSLYRSSRIRHRLQLAVVVPATFIREVVAAVP